MFKSLVFETVWQKISNRMQQHFELIMIKHVKAFLPFSSADEQQRKWAFFCICPKWHGLWVALSAVVSVLPFSRDAAQRGSKWWKVEYERNAAEWVGEQTEEVEGGVGQEQMEYFLLKGQSWSLFNVITLEVTWTMWLIRSTLQVFNKTPNVNYILIYRICSILKNEAISIKPVYCTFNITLNFLCHKKGKQHHMELIQRD